MHQENPSKVPTHLGVTMDFKELPNGFHVSTKTGLAGTQKFILCIDGEGSPFWFSILVFGNHGRLRVYVLVFGGLTSVKFVS